MKKALVILFAAVMLMTQVCSAAPAQPEEPEDAALAAQDVTTEETEEAADAAGASVVANETATRRISSFLSPELQKILTGPVLDQLTVGNPNPMWGEFFTDLWGNITSDQDVRSLIHGYNLIYWDGENGLFTYDPSVVAAILVQENPAGDHIYTFELADDLYYSDGTQITAWDYAFSLLLQIAPEMAELGATPARKPQLTGYQDYIDGKREIREINMEYNERYLQGRLVK